MAFLPRFLTVGLINTAVGILTIALCLLLGLGDYAANAVGYAVGVIFSFALHRSWTFRLSGPANLKETARFGIAVGMSYFANLAVLYLGRSAGFVDDPLLHVAAILTYTALFFLLTRHFVFAEARKDIGRTCPWRQSWPTWLLVASAMVAWLLLYTIRLSHDLHWQFWIARQMLGGTKLYADIWELNPPLWFWSAMPMQWLAESTGVPWQVFLTAQVVALGVASAWLVARLIDLPRPIDRASLMLAQFWIVTIAPLADIGQREHLALIVSLPYTALIARRRDGLPVSTPLAIFISVMAAYGFALKHYFAIIPLALEVWLVLKLRRHWRPIRTEVVILAALALIYAASIAILMPEFFTVMVPMVSAAYGLYNVPLLKMVVQPWALFWLGSTAFLCFYRPASLPFQNEVQRTFLRGLFIVAGGFVVAYFVQQKGWYYQSLPATGALAVSLALVLIAGWDRRSLRLTLGLILLLLPTSTLLTPRPANLPIAQVSDRLLGDVPAGETVFVAATAPRLAWPTVSIKGQVWPSRALVLWMLPAVARAEVSGHSTPELARLGKIVLEANSLDIRCHPPRKIIFQRMPLASQGQIKIGLEDFLLRDANLRAFIRQHYDHGPGSSLATVYERRYPVTGLASTQCRAIY